MEVLYVGKQRKEQKRYEILDGITTRKNILKMLLTFSLGTVVLLSTYQHDIYIYIYIYTLTYIHTYL